MLDKTATSTLERDKPAATEDAQYFEYTSSANPIGAKLISRVPYRSFLASLYDSGPTRVIPLDLSADLGCEAPATGPGLCANFVRVLTGENVTLNPNATSLVFYVVDGSGIASQGSNAISFAKGDFFTLPGGNAMKLQADYADRETNYCPGCQTGGKLLADRSLSRLLKADWPQTVDDLE